jgi:hypothetical protein
MLLLRQAAAGLRDLVRLADSVVLWDLAVLVVLVVLVVGLQARQQTGTI